jgi:hypothetical protein
LFVAVVVVGVVGVICLCVCCFCLLLLVVGRCLSRGDVVQAMRTVVPDDDAVHTDAVDDDIAVADDEDKDDDEVVQAFDTDDAADTDTDDDGDTDDEDKDDDEDPLEGEFEALKAAYAMDRLMMMEPPGVAVGVSVAMQPAGVSRSIDRRLPGRRGR